MYLTVQLLGPRLPAPNCPRWQRRHSSTTIVVSVELLRQQTSCVWMWVCGGGGKRGGWIVFGFLLLLPAATLCFDFLVQWLNHSVPLRVSKRQFVRRTNRSVGGLELQLLGFRWRGWSEKAQKRLVSMTLVWNVTVVHSNVCLVCLSPLTFCSDLDEGMDPGFFSFSHCLLLKHCLTGSQTSSQWTQPIEHSEVLPNTARTHSNVASEAAGCKFDNREYSTKVVSLPSLASGYLGYLLTLLMLAAWQTSRQ